MHLDDGQSALLKPWIIKRLEDVSDADSDVLADYVLALVKSDEPEDQVRQNCLDNLRDFLPDNTDAFVDSVLTAIRTKAYDPKQTPAKPAFAPTAPAFTPNNFGGGGQTENFANGTRKRSFHDEDVVMSDGSSRGGRGGRGGDRPFKQMRRGGRGYDQRGGRPPSRPHMQQQAQQMPQLPPMDPNNPLAALMAMQAMGFNLPGMPQMPKIPGQRCQDYDTKGFCALGASCPYEHGNDRLVVPGQTEEYDPNNAVMSQNGERNQRFHDRGRGRGRGRGERGGHRGGRGGRAEFSSAGPNHDRNVKSVVVEMIPEEHFSEEAVRAFFSEFGEIEEVNLQAYKRLAIIKFSDYAGAKGAYDSPKVIFDNRFVKVYWYKPDGLPKPPPHHQNGEAEHTKPTGGDVEMQEEEERVDPAEFAKKQEEAQRNHEEKMKQIQAAQDQRQQVEAQLKAQAEERNKLLAKLAARERAKTGTPDQTKLESPNTAAAAPASQTDALKAKLAALEAEAKSIGINPEDQQADPGFSGRGRGGYRGRGAWRGASGAWRGGRGSYATPRGGAVMRLDNRPKTVCIELPEGKTMGPEIDEALKQYLLFVSIVFSILPPVLEVPGLATLPNIIRPLRTLGDLKDRT